MGIPGFASWLRQRYPQAFRDRKPGEHFDNVYIDLASTLHIVTRRARTRSGFHMLLHRRLDELLDLMGPSKRVVIAMDGPAPLAKLLEQRRRRRREADRDDNSAQALAALDPEISPVEPAEGGPDARSSRRKIPEFATAVSPLFLTTGTVFMLEVHNSLACYICHRLADPRYEHLHFELSDSTVKGEGELKILSRLITAVAEGREGESHAVIGGDSDLVVMSMISGRSKLVVCDDRPPKERARGGKGHRSPHVLFCRDALQAAWEKEGHLPQGASKEEFSALSLDLALLSIICNGNDYLPACQGLSIKCRSRPGLWNLYLDMRRRPEWQGQWLVHLIPPTDEQQTSDAGTDQNGTGKPAPVHPPVSINRPMLAALLQRHHEQKYVAAPPVSNADAFAGAWEYGGELKPAAAKAAATPPPEPLVPPNRLPPDTGAYLEGLEWVLAMYVTGGIRDYRYSYPATSPLPQTLIAHLQESSSALGDASPPPTPGSQDEEGLENLVEKIRGATTTRSLLQPLIPAACALALLPARSRRQAASPLRHLMDADSPIAEIYAVCKECRRIAGDIRSVAAELDGVRKELSTLQDELSAAGLDSEGALEAEADLASAVEKWEAAGERLKDLLKGLSRSQQAHLAEKHPYKPFPTEELEAAVQAVPPDRYPPWERKLARFGREMLFKRAEGPQGNAEMAAAVLRPVEEGVNGDFHGLPGWLKDCSRFATSYPKVADVEVVRGAALTVAREFLPLHPYMQPGLRIHARRRRPAAPPAAIAGARGFRVPTAAAAASFQRGVAWPSGVLPAVPGALRVAGMPRMEAGAAASARSGTAKLALAMCARMFPRLRSLARACF